MKKILLIALAAVMVICVFTSCQQSTAQSESTDASIANPVVEVESTDDFNNPMTLPAGTTGNGFSIIDNSVDEMRFTDADGNEYFARATQDQELADDLEAFTGLYGEWKTQEGMGDIKYATVTVDTDKYYVAHWQTDNNVYYCLAGPEACTDQIVKYAEEMSGY